MILKIFRLCLFSFLLYAGGSCIAQNPTNPILPNADPFITLHPVDGRYILLATTGKNISLWSGPTIPQVASKVRVVFEPNNGMTELWSPTLWQINDRWWIYFTAKMPGEKHAIFVLESNTPDALGTYSFRGQLQLGRPAIDPSLLIVNNVRYLMYVTVDKDENAIYIVRLKTPLEPTGDKSLIAEPEYPWEKGAGSTKNYPVTEGPTALYHNANTFIVYSGSDTASPVYCLGLMTLKGSDPLLRQSWIKTNHPVFSANPSNGIYGPGRGTFAIASDGSDWLLYAAKTNDTPTSANRTTRVQHFGWNADGTPNFGIPKKVEPFFDR
jgi:GH43 family beta-xylosidase